MFKRGFTLIEVMVVVSIMLILTGVIGYFFRSVFVLSDQVQSGLDVEYGIRQTLRQWVAEVRAAEPSVAGAYPLLNLSDESMTIYSDLTGDGNSEKIVYRRSDTDLLKEVYVASGSPLGYPTDPDQTITLSQNVQNNGSQPIFSYYASGDVVTATALSSPISVGDVRYVVLSLTLDADPNRPPQAVTTQTGVSIRNIKDNL